jgi:branched-chain amino acid transport system substrate-binding protein
MGDGLRATAMKTAIMKAAIMSAGLLVATASLAQSRQYDPGASDTEITIGQTVTYSGPPSSLSLREVGA